MRKTYNDDRVWMKVTLDEYRLPVAVADSARELAQLCGTTVNCIFRQRSRYRKNMAAYPWICVQV